MRPEDDLVAELGRSKAEKALAACVELYFGSTIAEAASAAGVSENTIYNWRGTEWWPELEELVEDSGLDYLERKARGVVRDKLKDGDGKTARWLLERRSKPFAPPKKQVQVEGNVDHRHEAKQLRSIPTAVIENMADADDDAIEAFFEEKRPLGELPAEDPHE